MYETPASHPKKHHKASWIPTVATVYSVVWFEASRNNDAHYDVTFSYRVNGELETGHFTDYTSEADSYLKRGDEIEVLYNPANPCKTYYPYVHTATKRRLIACGLGFALGAVALILSLLHGKSGR